MIFSGARCTVLLTVLFVFACSCLFGQQASIPSQKPIDTHILDLTVFRWICAQASVDAETTRLARRLSQGEQKPISKTAEWAFVTFLPTGNPSKLVTPDPEDKRIPQLLELKSDITAALRNRQTFPVQAADGLNRTQTQAGDLGLEVSQAILLKLLGDLYLYDMAKHTEALSCYSRAALVFGKAEETYAAYAILYDDLAYLKLDQGIYSEAREHYVQAALHWQALASEDPKNISLLLDVGRKYMQAGDADRAAGNFEGAVELKNKGLDSIRKYAHADKSYNILMLSLIDTAELHADSANPKRADVLLEEARKLVDRSNDLLLVARLYRVSSKVFEALGNKQQMELYARKQKQTLSKASLDGESAIFKLGGHNPTTQAARIRLINTSMVGAQAYSQLQNKRRAIALWDFIAEYNEKENKTENKITALRALGSIYASDGNIQTAKECMKRAVEIAEAGATSAITLDAMQSYVDFLESAGDMQEALRAYTGLISSAEAIGNLRAGAAARVGRANLLAASQKYDDAINDLQNASQRYLSQIGDVGMYARTSLALSDMYVRAGRSSDAAAVLETATSQPSLLHYSVVVNYQTSRVMTDICASLVRLYLAEDMTDKAGALLYKFSTSFWMPMLTRKLAEDSDPKVAELALNWSEKGDYADPGEMDVKYGLLAEDVATFTQVCWSLAETRKASYSSLPVDPLSLMPLRHLIPGEDVFVEYMVTDSSVYVFVLGQKLSICIEVRDAARDTAEAWRALKKAIKKCETSLTTGVPVAPVMTRNEPAFMEVGEPLTLLYKLLLRPVQEILPEQGQIYFALPPQLFGMPMHALLLLDEEGRNKYLCEQYCVSYASSSFVKSIARGTKPVFYSNLDRLAILADPLGNLPGARREASAISSVYRNNASYTGARASANTFYSELSKADLLHIAAHHSIDSGSVKQLLELAPAGGESGYVSLSDLLEHQPIRPKLVFMSTCDALYSSDAMTDTLNKTGEAFLLAGAGGVLGGLWKISDEAQVQMASEFYKGLVEGKNVYQAIRRAQLSMIESTGGRFAHPYYWAALALYGSPD